MCPNAHQQGMKSHWPTRGSIDTPWNPNGRSVSRRSAGLHTRLAIQRFHRFLEHSYRFMDSRQHVNSLNRLFVRGMVRLGRLLGSRPQIPVVPVETQTGSKGYPEVTPSACDPAVRLIAFYLPQFHPFPENDKWWGKGFTEWTNVGKATPNYKGHVQPHCPIHLGYYDLRLVDNMVEQANLARLFGLYGFCYYFYWFDGVVLMRQPLEQMLADKRVDMPFCLMWANENWSRRWDGKEDDILIAQKHSTQDSLAFIRHLESYFRDERYIKVEGKPVLAVYRANLIPDIKSTAALWREEARRMGFPGLYLLAAQSFDIEAPEPFGFDAAVQFPPHPINYPIHNDEVEITNPSYTGQIYDYNDAARRFVTLPTPDYKLLRTCMLSWDNTARKQDSSLTFKDFSITTYQQWLSHNVNVTLHDTRLGTDEHLTFVNAWNEWAEGTHLEPDRHHGFGYLQATHEVLRQYDSRLVNATTGNVPAQRRHKAAVIVHLHYAEVFEQLAAKLDAAFPARDVDLFVTVTSGTLAALVRQRFAEADIQLVENRGRDILPFIETYRRIHHLGYQAICKVHSKRSLYRQDGARLLDGLIGSLIGSSQRVQAILQQMKDDDTLGMLVPADFLLRVTSKNTASNMAKLDKLEALTGVRYGYADFAAGTMFWFRPAALTQILALQPEHFDLERGLADGTLAHAVERMTTSWCRASGFSVKSVLA